MDNLKNHSFSSFESKYLEQRDIIKMCIVPNILPYSDIKNGEFVGFVSEYIKLIEYDGVEISKEY